MVRSDVNGVETARYRFTEPAAPGLELLSFAPSGDGRRLAAMAGILNRARSNNEHYYYDVTINVWDAATGRVESSRAHTIDLLVAGGFSKDLKWYFQGNKAISVVDGPDLLLDFPAKRFPLIALSPDGRLIAQPTEEEFRESTRYWTEPRGIVICELATGKQVMNLAAGKCGRIAFSTDGRGLVVPGPDDITRWDLTTRKPVVRHPAPIGALGDNGPSFASSLTVTPDGNRALTGHIDTTAILWDLTVTTRAAKRLSPRELTDAWAALAAADAGKAYDAIWSLADAAADAMPFLSARMRPAAALDEPAVGTLIAKLDSAAFAEREAAAKSLRQLGDAVAARLRDALKASPTPEQKVRLERLLAEVASPALPPGDRLRQVRAIAALEMMATTDARNLLDKLARGAPTDRQTEEAAAALTRLRLRQR